MEMEGSVDCFAAKRMCLEKLDSPPASNTGAHLLDLNDDCFFETFKYLDPVDLCAIADVCSRLRETAQASFAHSNLYGMTLPRDILVGCGEMTASSQLLKMSRMVRNFGPLVSELREVEEDECNFFNQFDGKARSKYRHRLFELVTKYCTQNLEVLQLTHFAATDQMLSYLDPFVHLRRLYLNAYETSEALLERLPALCPHLTYLGFSSCRTTGEKLKPLRFDVLDRPFPKLLILSFIDVDNLQNSDIDAILKWNRQLICLFVSGCRNVDIRIVKSIAEHVPTIEHINLHIGKNASIKGFSPKEFGKLGKLKSLTMEFPKRSTDAVVSAIHQMAKANVPLIKLKLESLTLKRNLNQFVDAISNMKTLETLYLRATRGLNGSHILDITKSLHTLTDFDFAPDFQPSLEFIQELIRSGDNLKGLCVFGSCDGVNNIAVGVEFFQDVLKIVRERPGEKNLELSLCFAGYYKNFPDELAEAHAESLSMRILNTNTN